MNLRESYRTLRLQDRSTLDEVKKAYRVLAFQLHPDLNPDDPHAARHFQRVNEAYVLLKRHLETNAQEPPGASPTSGGADEPPGEDVDRWPAPLVQELGLIRTRRGAVSVFTRPG